MIDTLITHLNANLFMSILALIVAICSMYVAFQTWLLKKGIRLEEHII